MALLDADSFPEETYFEVLINKLKQNPSIGLIGGVLKFEDGTRDGSNNINVRGSGRVWNYKCFKMMDDYYGLSPDAISQRRAIIDGFSPKVVESVHFVSREANSRVSYSFKGKSTYYNGYTVFFTLLKGLSFALKKPKWGLEFFYGYFWSIWNSMEKNPDKEIIEFNKSHLKRVIKRKLFK